MSSKVANFLKGISLVLGIDADGTRVPLCRHSPPKMLRDARMAGLVKLQCGIRHMGQWRLWAVYFGQPRLGSADLQIPVPAHSRRSARLNIGQHNGTESVVFASATNLGQNSDVVSSAEKAGANLYRV